MAAKKPKKIHVKLTGGLAGRTEKQRACVRGLGLRKVNHSVEVEDTPSIRGMINKVAFLLQVEEA